MMIDIMKHIFSWVKYVGFGCRMIQEINAILDD
jgi:hypothetical protein